VNTLVVEPDTYYELRGAQIEFSGADIEGAKKHWLRQGDIVLCTEIVKLRVGGEGRGRYAKLLFRDDEGDLVLWFRVSRFNRGAATWREVNSMIVLAKADVLPTL
jgi:hypothetical protein